MPKTLIINGKMQIVDFEAWIEQHWPRYTDTRKPIIPTDCTNVDNDGKDCIARGTPETWCHSCCVYTDLVGDFYAIFPDY